jgi:hypothetical protein
MERERRKERSEGKKARRVRGKNKVKRVRKES